MVRLDLRAEPIVLCMSEIDKDRYYDVQRVDMYTDNYGYIIGSNTKPLVRSWLPSHMPPLATASRLRCWRS